MYLKSLVLKGFKSFADRSVLTLEPGITAIVGPNGSGKSNISDAVLWVLGERNARHLRGSAMEDVIFSGSSARKPVSYAEVELVLDNTDRMLPIDFDEVSVSRRMYRSGESEYLVNGVVSRRMDVLDILHDTGLGAGTHTIISQGNLDQILQSKPEDRRSLIEEAAGVLKHKQRKERSARKLAAMDLHLTRVRDVVAEINRQLGPLERKAKRAVAYQEASERLREVKLALAVDDLRKLQGQWERLGEQEAALSAELSQQRDEVTRAEQSVNDIQELIRTKADSAGELARSQRRTTAVSERFDGAVLLLRQKQQSAQTYESDILAAVETARQTREAAIRERDAAYEQLNQARAALERAQAAVDDREARRADVVRERNDVQKRIEQLEVDQRRLTRACDEARRNLAHLNESLSSGVAQEKLHEARRTEIEGQLTRANHDHDGLTEALNSAHERFAALESAEKTAQEALARAFEARNAARAESDAKADEERVLSAEIKAVKQSLRATRSEAPALIWLMDNAQRFGGDLVPFAHALGAPSDLENLVERLLGDDLAALMVRDAAMARNVADVLLEQRRSGDVAVVFEDDNVKTRRKAAGAPVGVPLLEKLHYTQEAARIVESLLGDVVICASRDEAFRAHEQDERGLRFVTADGCVVWPQGKVVVYGAIADEREGVLARERRLAELEARVDDAHEQALKAADALQGAEEAYRAAQEASLKASQERAQQKGVLDAARNEEQRSLARVSALVREHENALAQLEHAVANLDKLRPDVEALQTSLDEQERERDQLAQRIADAMDEVAPLRRRAGALGEELANARLEAATLKERLVYAERLVEARRSDIQQAERTLSDSSSMLTGKRVAQMRAVPVLDALESLSRGLRTRMQVLDDAILASQNLADGFQASAAEARRNARLAQEALDGVNARMTTVQVEKGRLEVLVQSAVSAVVDELATPLEVAERLPQLEARAEFEQEATKLANRIKNMGVINPDAAEEYEKLKKRYDYFTAQLDDVAAARKSLAKIVRMIDERMRDDFAVTFEKVNQNFNEIFAVLFPGGHAELALEDPDDIEHTGVEVKAQPRGKRITKMTLMSGGEKSLTALALLFAIYRIRKTPFYILDEVEAALDDSNLRRLISYIDSLRTSTQLIMITHQRRSMEMADVLFGVSMQSDGVTKVLSQKLERTSGKR